MSIIPLEWEAVRSTCLEASARFADLVRTAPDPGARVAGLDWTVAELAAHLVSLTVRYEPFLQGKGEAFYATMPEMNAKELEALARLSLEELAGILERGTETLLALCPAGDAPARFFDAESDCASAVALYVEELLVHGVDLARTIGRPWAITSEEAIIAIGGLLMVLPKFIDADATRGFHAVYELRLRGGPTVTMAINESEATFTHGTARRADCRISADPTAFLLIGANRQSQWRGLFTGKMLAFGRKPWLGLRFKKLLVSA